MKGKSMITCQAYMYFKWDTVKGEIFPVESFILKELMRSSAKDNESISRKRNQIVTLYPIFMLLHIRIE